MKSILSTITILLLASLPGQTKECSDGSSNGGGINDVTSYVTKPSDFVPLPWGSELPFPWKNVQGLWVANVGNNQAYYTFEVVGESYSPDKQLLIKQYDLKTCDIVAIGVGLENENKTIWALMKPMFLPKAYRFGLRNFSADVLPKHLPSLNGRVMVMSVSTIGSLKMNYFPMQKVASPATSPLATRCKWSVR